MAALIQELESKALALTNEEFFLTKIKLQGAAEMFRVSTTSNLNPLAWTYIIINHYILATLQPESPWFAENH